MILNHSDKSIHVLDHFENVLWLDDEHRFLVLVGGAGSGKAVPSTRLSRLGGFGRMAGGVVGNVMLSGARELASGKRPQMRDLMLTPGNAARVEGARVLARLADDDGEPDAVENRAGPLTVYCGLRPGYYADRLNALDRIADHAQANDTKVVWY